MDDLKINKIKLGHLPTKMKFKNTKPSLKQPIQLSIKIKKEKKITND